MKSKLSNSPINTLLLKLLNVRVSRSLPSNQLHSICLLTVSTFHKHTNNFSVFHPISTEGWFVVVSEVYNFTLARSEKLPRKIVNTGVEVG